MAGRIIHSDSATTNHAALHLHVPKSVCICHDLLGISGSVPSLFLSAIPHHPHCGLCVCLKQLLLRLVIWTDLPSISARGGCPLLRHRPSNSLCRSGQTRISVSQIRTVGLMNSRGWGRPAFMTVGVSFGCLHSCSRSRACCVPGLQPVPLRGRPEQRDIPYPCQYSV